MFGRACHGLTSLIGDNSRWQSSRLKFASHIECFDPDEGEGDAAEIDPTIRSMTEQRDHKTRTVSRAYINHTGAPFVNLRDEKVRMGLQASTLWQDFWGTEMMLRQNKRGRAEQESLRQASQGVAPQIPAPNQLEWRIECLSTPGAESQRDRSYMQVLTITG